MNFKMSLVILLGISMFARAASALSDDNRPDYQKEYDAYLKDLEVIAETGQAPKNLDLEADLRKMDSNEKILLNVEKKAANAVYYAQNSTSNKATIVDRVELVRIPKEYREKYDGLSQKNEAKLSTQDVAEDQMNAEKNLIDEVSSKQVAHHQNPFRFLKEVEMSDKHSLSARQKNELVGAYFGQGQAAFVNVPKNEKEKLDSEKKEAEDPEKTEEPEQKAEGAPAGLR